MDVVVAILVGQLEGMLVTLSTKTQQHKWILDMKHPVAAAAAAAAAGIIFLPPFHQAAHRLHIFMLPTIFGKLFMAENCLPNAYMQYAGQDLQEQGTFSPVLDEQCALYGQGCGKQHSTGSYWRGLD